MVWYFRAIHDVNRDFNINFYEIHHTVRENLFLRKNFYYFLLAISILLFSHSSLSEGNSLVGHWKAIDRDSNATSIIELYMDGEYMNGRIAKIIDQAGKEIDPICDKCDGPLKNKPLVGLTFIYGLQKQGVKWINGKVIDLRPGPWQGVIASCEIELLGEKARIHGYLWLRVLGGESNWDRAI